MDSKYRLTKRCFSEQRIATIKVEVNTLIHTEIIEIDPSAIDMDKLAVASDILKNGGTVAFPTETVYGLGANALEETSIKKIFEAKGRPSDNPLIVHIAAVEDIKPLVADIPNHVDVLMERFWPGPLTLVFRKSSLVPPMITGGLDTVAIRMPAHPIARTLIAMAGVPVAAPSANLSGKPSPTQASHVVEDLLGRVDAIISGGSCKVGLESTVLDITGEVPMILRPGGVTKEELESVIGKVVIDRAIEGGDEKHLVPKSPGMKYTHYAPKAEVVVVEGEQQSVVSRIQQMQREKQKTGMKVGIMATDETKDKYDNAQILSVGSRERLETITNNLFRVLRAFDEIGVDIILAEAIERKGLGDAIMNRLLKAAGNHVVKADGGE
ncbi:L-threonylcarbamoyladenylate synthase [Anaerosolibacter carboniphilus]|uniref:Threonylcarbamoyl-AMP synthase n=1 Tax=Anaerosolibacter carboniphilus TaxID=1417629 RepID=A0A841KUC2_9FIRM|nr:L-threonylcarbamoyladenylate synthase [Anaerosolibacter carboniphilus]MBB6215620.1 L-threonylcarbamoyladenylate synthase [Anaerosolibacter carboniphilus]